jgi:hypothetical protein
MSALFLPLIFERGNVDELDAAGVELADVAAVLAPVAVGALVDDPPLLEQALQDQVDGEAPALEVLGAQRQVLEVNEYGQSQLRPVACVLRHDRSGPLPRLRRPSYQRRRD